MKPVKINFTLKNFVTSVEVTDENNTFRSEFTAMNNHDRESLHRLIVFVSQNCHASRFQVNTEDKRSQTLAQKESQALSVVSADQESDSQGSEAPKQQDVEGFFLNAFDEKSHPVDGESQALLGDNKEESNGLQTESKQG